MYVHTHTHACLWGEWLLLLTEVHRIHTSSWWILSWSWYSNCKGSWPSGAEGIRGVPLCRISSWGWSRASWEPLQGPRTNTQTHTTYQSIIFRFLFCGLLQNITWLSDIFASYSSCADILIALLLSKWAKYLNIKRVWCEGGLLISNFSVPQGPASPLTSREQSQVKTHQSALTSASSVGGQPVLSEADKC